MPEERLQKVMAAAGLGSRRACEQLISTGNVRVNGQPVVELGTKVDPERDQITVDGKPLRLPRRPIYLKLHKPRGVLGDIGDDPEGRQTVADLIPEDMRRVFPVGRLDLQSEGLVLLTDDGDLANKLTHPRYEHLKLYYVLVDQRPTEQALAKFRHGIDLPEGRTARASVRVVHSLPGELKLSRGPTEGVWLEVGLREGKKRQIRHMTAAIGHPTLRLVRWAIGPLTLGGLKAGQWAPLTHKEVTALRQTVAEGSGVGSKGAPMNRPRSLRGRSSTQKGAEPARRKPRARP